MEAFKRQSQHVTVTGHLYEARNDGIFIHIYHYELVTVCTEDIMGVDRAYVPCAQEAEN